MMTIRVQYDGYNRYFRILDQELAALLEDGNVYVLSLSDDENDPQIDWIELRQSAIAHA